MSLRPVSRKRARRDRKYPAAREAVRERSGGMCEAPVHYPTCGWWGDECHHIAGRGGPDPHRLSNLYWLSRACHEAAHKYPEWAREVGLMRSRHGGAA